VVLDKFSVHLRLSIVTDLLDQFLVLKVDLEEWSWLCYRLVTLANPLDNSQAEGQVEGFTDVAWLVVKMNNDCILNSSFVCKSTAQVRPARGGIEEAIETR
jgi:hypothetical protein